MKKIFWGGSAAMLLQFVSFTTSANSEEVIVERVRVPNVGVFDFTGPREYKIHGGTGPVRDLGAIYHDANSHCNKLTNDHFLFTPVIWRLPTTKELQILHQYFPGNKINTVLGWPIHNDYWTSSIGSNGEPSEYSFKYGEVVNSRYQNPAFVLCIKTTDND